MTVLPLIERELRVRARSWATYWSRFIVVLVGLLICLPQLIFAGPFGTAATTGKYVFDAIVVAAFMLSCGGCLLTADLISAERREGTLGLLFLTRVKGLDVVLGKLGAGGLTSLCAMAALLPVFIIPILAGGVTGGEAARKGLALVNTLFVALALGLWSSAAHHDRFKAARQALLSLLLLLLLPLLMGGSAVGRRFPPSHYLRLFSPLVAIISAADGSYRASPTPFWVSLGIGHGLAWLLLARTGVRLGQRFPEETNSSATSQYSHEDAVAVRPSKQRHFRGDAGPVEWLVQRQRGLRAMLWWAAIAGFFYYIGFMVFGRFLPFGFSAVSYILTSSLPGLAMGALGGGLIAWAASRFFVETRRSGALELLLTTPLGAGAIVADQWRVLMRLLYWPMLLMVLPPMMEVGLMASGLRSILGGGVQYLVYSILSLTNIVLGVAALCWLGLWFGLKARGQSGAIVWTLSLAKGVPYLINLVWGVFFSALLPRRSAFFPAWYVLIWLLPQIVVLLFYVWLIRSFRNRLLRELAGSEPASLDLRRALQHARTWKTT